VKFLKGMARADPSRTGQGKNLPQYRGTEVTGKKFDDDFIWGQHHYKV
jgi:hypothetical protein